MATAPFFSIFFNVVTPVFLLAALGYVLGPRLGIQYRSLSRTAYYLLVPAFIFDVLSQVSLDLSTAARMVAGISSVYIATGVLGWLTARFLGYGREMAVAFLMTCVYGNVGNFGLALTQFRLGNVAMESATVYMVTVNTVAFFFCVLAAAWVRRGGFTAVVTLFKTPGVAVLPLALFFPVMGIAPPMMVQRVSGLLGDAMIPMMLLVLGLQLREAGTLSLGRPVMAACAVRLILGPALALVLIPFFGLSGMPASAGILQGAMPPAVLTAVIAMEHELVPSFVISVVFAGTLLSLVTLTVVMSVI